MTAQRLCILGDSHLGAVNLAWDGLRSHYPELRVDRFPTPGGLIRRTKLVRRTIVPTSEKVSGYWQRANGDVTEIVLDEYDAVVLVGYGSSPFSHARLLRSHSLSGFRAANKNRAIISRGALVATLEDRLRDKKSYRYSRVMSEKAGLPLFIIPTPRPVSARLTSGDLKWMGKTVPREELEEYQACFDSAFTTVLSEINGELLAQPMATREGGLFSRPEFKRNGAGVLRDVSKPGRVDNVHMNVDYGRAVLQAHLPTIVAAISARREGAIQRSHVGS
ncbi:MAG TPA: hypothetical protein VMP03_15585 [Methylomirabilota bacterium]|nr:hypothetical protein [Methylomirabilota bacterium]